MICNNCRKNFSEPLTLFNGEWACPHCCQKLELTTRELEETEENTELFIQGESSLLKALLLNNVGNVNINKQFDEYIKLAYYCFQKSADLGNPNAFYRLGFLYDKALIEKNRTQKNRCQIALKYYLTACKKTTNEAIKNKSAIALVKMLSTSKYFPNELALYKKEYETQLRGIDLNKIKTQTNYFEFVRDTLLSLNDSYHAPIFGTLTVTENDIERLLEIKKSFSPKAHIQVYIEGQSMVCNGIESAFKSLFDWNNIKKDKLDLSKKITIIFFKRKFNSSKLKRKSEKIYESIMGNQCKYIVNLLNDKFYNDSVFYEDDLIYYLNKHSIDDGLGLLAEAVCNK